MIFRPISNSFSFDQYEMKVFLVYIYLYIRFSSQKEDNAHNTLSFALFDRIIKLWVGCIRRTLLTQSQPNVSVAEDI